MLNPEILLGDRIENTSRNVFNNIQKTFLGGSQTTTELLSIDQSIDPYILSTLLPPFLFSLDFSPLSVDETIARRTLVESLLTHLERTLKPNGSFVFRIPHSKSNNLFTTSLCLLNLMDIYQVEAPNCYHYLRNGLCFLEMKLKSLSPKINRYRADECLAAYTLLQASIILNDKKYSNAGSKYFNSVLVSSKSIALGKSDLLPNSVDEALITRILFDIYGLSGKEQFLFQALNLSKAALDQDRNILESLENGGGSRFFDKAVNLPVLSLSCYNWIRRYQITQEDELLELSSFSIRFLTDIINISLKDNILFPSWIKPRRFELSQESSPIGARFYLDAAILGREYFPVSITQAIPKKVIPLLRVRA